MMTQKELLKLAKKHNVSPRGLSTVELIRKLQQSEGNFDCYGRASEGVCDQSACLWREECLEISPNVH